MPPEQTPADDTRTADTGDGGWTVESHSAPTDPNPTDTTAGAIAAEAQTPAPAAEAGAADAVAAASDDAGEGETFLETGTMPSAEVPAPGAGKAKPKGKASAQARFNELTSQKRHAERERDQERARREDLERRIAALEGAGRTAQPTTPVDTTATAPSADAAMPEPPRYIDFETDDAYNDAVKTWRTQTVAWQAARDARLKTEITTGMETRLTAEREAARVAAAEEAMIGRLRHATERHPDFAEKVTENAQVFESITVDDAPFLHDIIQNTPDGGELLYDLASDPDMALALGALPLPTRPLADAVRSSPAARTIMKYFATPEGRESFLRLRQLPPLTVLREVGKLEARLEDADPRGPASPARPITSAVPPAKPPVGSPRARAVPGAGAPASKFEDWMADEDARERAEHLRAAGVPTSV